MTNVQDEITPHIDEHDENVDAEDAGGTTPSWLSLPDQAPMAELIAAITTGVAQAIENERKRYQERRAGFLEGQAGGNVFFQRYYVPIGQPVQICREKSGRSLVIISAYNPGSVSVGLHAGIMALGTDTVTVDGTTGANNNVREIPTTMALWAISNHLTDSANIDVLEIFV